MEFDTETYIALAGDIVSSKALADRNAVQTKLHRVLEKINNKYA